jgi:hypothetical protein
MDIKLARFRFASDGPLQNVEFPFFHLCFYDNSSHHAILFDCNLIPLKKAICNSFRYTQHILTAESRYYHFA